MKFTFFFAICLAVLIACSPSSPATNTTPRAEIEVGDTVFLASGVKYVFIKKAEEGAFVTRENPVTTHINLYANGINAWSTYEPLRPFTFVLNETPMIAGFDEVIMYMREGDQIHAMIPSHLGYGASGNGPRIPPNAELLFDIEVLQVVD